MSFKVYFTLPPDKAISEKAFEVPILGVSIFVFEAVPLAVENSTVPAPVVDSSLTFAKTAATSIADKTSSTFASCPMTTVGISWSEIIAPEISDKSAAKVVAPAKPKVATKAVAPIIFFNLDILLSSFEFSHCCCCFATRIIV